MYVKLSWRPEVDENWAIMVVQPAILTYPTMVCYFWLGPQVLWNDLRGIILSRDLCAHICYGIWLFGPPWEPEGDESIDKPFYFNLPPAWTTDRARLGRSVCHKLFLVRGKGRKSAEASGGTPSRSVSWGLKRVNLLCYSAPGCLGAFFFSFSPLCVGHLAWRTIANHAVMEPSINRRPIRRVFVASDEIGP
jgi:hypothetical protein